MKIGITERGDGGLDFSKVKEAIDSGMVDGAIVVTKCPSRLLSEMDYLLAHQSILIHAVITGLGGSVFEPNVNLAEVELEAYKTLFNKLPDRVILRVDPIILEQEYIMTQANIINKALGRIRISFLDTYPHVRERFKKAGLTPNQLFHYDISKRSTHLEKCKMMLKYQSHMRGIDIEVCGEPDMECTGCISSKDIMAMGLMDKFLEYRKTSSQRPTCHCLSSKVELLNNKHPCYHQCLYCYWKDA
jgi:hypothetical protein